MFDYERYYRTGRIVSSVLEILGWVIVIAGIFLALDGLVSGGFLGRMSRGFGSADTPFLLRLLAALPGVVAAASGLFIILNVQTSRASLDTSEMTRELLAIARGESGAKNAAKPKPSQQKPERKFKLLAQGPLVKEFQGHKIYKHPEGVTVDGEVFPNVVEAVRYLSIQGRSH